MNEDIKNLPQLLNIAELAIKYYKASLITQERLNDYVWCKNADAADIDEMDLEEILANNNLLYAVKRYVE